MTAQEGHFSWQILSLAEATERLTGAGYPYLPDPNDAEAAALGVGLLYFYGPDVPPQIVTWIQPSDDTALRRLRRQSSGINDFEHWLTKHHPVDIWQLAATWTFYEQWLTYAHHPNWLVACRKQFLPDSLVDQLLAQSQGWVMWRHQLDALIFAATGDFRRAETLARAWVLHPVDAPGLLAGLSLPNGVSLLSVLKERGVKCDDSTLIVRGRPNMYAVARIHHLYCARSS